MAVEAEANLRVAFVRVLSNKVSALEKLEKEPNVFGNIYKYLNRPKYLKRGFRSSRAITFPSSGSVIQKALKAVAATDAELEAGQTEKQNIDGEDVSSSDLSESEDSDSDMYSDQEGGGRRRRRSRKRRRRTHSRKRSSSRRGRYVAKRGKGAKRGRGARRGTKRGRRRSTSKVLVCRTGRGRHTRHSIF